MTRQITRMNALCSTPQKPAKIDRFIGVKRFSKVFGKNSKSENTSSLFHFSVVDSHTPWQTGHPGLVVRRTASFRLTKQPDYLMLNTDRGADNYMIKWCDADHDKSLVDVAPSRSAKLQMPSMTELRKPDGPPQIHFSPSIGPSTSTGSLSEDYTRRPHIHIAAIDNSLSFPHEHPKGWRKYTYGQLISPALTCFS